VVSFLVKTRPWYKKHQLNHYDHWEKPVLNSKIRLYVSVVIFFIQPCWEQTFDRYAFEATTNETTKTQDQHWSTKSVSACFNIVGR
jgi:hypothetical protein